MSFKLVVRPEVDADLLVAEEWYEDQESGLGNAFLRDVVATIERILVNPLIYRVRYGRRPVRTLADFHIGSFFTSIMTQ